jgi:yceI family protein
MKKIMFALCSAMLASAASAAVYKVDEFHANARFAIDHFNTSTNVGGIYGLTGNLEFDRAKRQGSIDIVLPLSKLQTGSDRFTQHLKSAEPIFSMQTNTLKSVLYPPNSISTAKNCCLLTAT